MIRILDRENRGVVGRLLTELRDKELQRDRGRFRQALERLGFILGHELTANLEHHAVAVETPLGVAYEPRLRKPPVVATVFRAGLPLWNGVIDALPESDVMMLGASRKEGSETLNEAGRLPIEASYAVLTPLEGRDLVYVDTMLATGSTLLDLHPRVIAEAGRPARIFVLGAIAYEPSLDLLARELGAEVLVGAADQELSSAGFILPGLGDAGDLAYGEPLRARW